MKNIIFLPAWTEIISQFDDREPRKILHKKTKMIFSYFNKILAELIKSDFIIKEKKQGRVVPLKLTEKGKRAKELLQELVKLEGLNTHT